MRTDAGPIRVLTVDDHALLREGIAALINAESDIKLVADACNGRDAIEKFRLYGPDVTLMDLQMPALNGRKQLAPGCDGFGAIAVQVGMSGPPR
jgi:chemotaxis response regulator CheB